MLAQNMKKTNLLVGFNNALFCTFVNRGNLQRTNTIVETTLPRTINAEKILSVIEAYEFDAMSK